MTACGYKNNHERLHHLPLINELRWHSLVNPSTVGLIITGSNITHNTAHHILMAENEHGLDRSLIKHTWWCHGVPWQASYNEYLRERWSSYYKTPLQPVWRDYLHLTEIAMNQRSLPSGLNPSCQFYLHGLSLIPAWISNYIHYKVWDEITYPFLNFNGCTVEV